MFALYHEEIREIPLYNLITSSIFPIFFFSYCNRRVVKFNAKGNEVLLEIGSDKISTYLLLTRR